MATTAKKKEGGLAGGIMLLQILKQGQKLSIRIRRFEEEKIIFIVKFFLSKLVDK